MPPQNEQKDFQAENTSPGHIFWNAVVTPINDPD